jgi:hypothetical protein
MTTGKSILRLAPRTSVVKIVEETATVTLPARSVILQTGLPGPPGPQGPPGGGGGGAAAYTHNQAPASALWTVTHNLGYRPAVSVWDTANDQVVGEVDHTSVNALTIAFSTAISGTAYMS